MLMSGMLFGQNQSMDTALIEANELLNNREIARANAILQSIIPSLNSQSKLDQNRIQVLQAKIWKKQNQLEKADSLYQILINQFSLLDADKDLALILKDRALVLTNLGLYDQALENLSRAKDLLKRDNNEELALVYNGIAIVYQEVEDDENQGIALNQALELLENSNNNHLKGVIHFNMANYYYLFEGEEDKVEENLRKATTYFKKENNTYLLIKAKELEITLSQEIEGQETITDQLYQQLLEETKTYKDSFLLAEVFYNYAAFKFNVLLGEDEELSTATNSNAKDVTNVIELAENALNFLPKEGKVSSLYVEIMTLIADMKYINQNYEESFVYLFEAQTIKEQLGQNVEINRTSFQNEWELNRANDLIVAQEKNLNLLRGLGVLLIVTILSLIFLITYMRRASIAQQKSLSLQLFGNFLQAFDQEKEQFQKEERKRISKTLHDKVSSQLAAIKWLFESKVDDLEQNKLESGGLNSIMKMIEDAYSETRKISKEIETEGPTTRILALRKKLANIQDNDRLKLDVQIEGFVGKSIQYYIEDHISAIVMEMMANTFKYARNASQLKIKILREEDAIQLHISDDGAGFDIEEKKNGHGIRNIHDRIEAMNGQIQFDAKKGVGVRLDALIPLE